MSETLGMRSLSMGASALILSAIAFAGLNATWVVLQTNTVDPPIINVSAPPLEPPLVTPPPEPVRAAPLAQGVVIGAISLPVIPEALTAHAAPSDFTNSALLPEIVDAHWRRRPRDLARYYPSRAIARGMEGAVTLDCLVSVQGRLGCTVLTETPEGWGFGAAALRIAADHEMAPATRDGAPTEARYRMRVPFAIE